MKDELEQGNSENLLQNVIHRCLTGETVKDYDDAIIVLPITGGTGRTTLFAIAGTITALGVALIIISKKRRTA